MEENQQNTPSQELPVTTVVETDTNDKKIKPSKITGNLVALIVVLVVALLVAVVMDIIFYMNVQSLQLMSAESVRALEEIGRAHV